MVDSEEQINLVNRYPFIQRLIMVLSSAGILAFFSEFYFFNEGPAGSAVKVLSNPSIETLLFLGEFLCFYALFTYPFLICISYFNVSTVSALFLAACIFGWVTEGLIIPVIYEAIPISFIWTSVSWHAIIDVLFGWYFISVVILKRNLLLSAVMSIIIGLFWGVWATWLWIDEEFIRTEPHNFTIYAFCVSVFWIMSHFIFLRFGSTDFKPTRYEILFVIFYCAFFGTFMAIPYLPFSLLFLPLLFFTFFVLNQNRKQHQQQTILKFLNKRKPSILYFLPLFLVPVCASFSYTFMLENNLHIPTDDFTALFLVTGTIFLCLAYWKVLKNK